MKKHILRSPVFAAFLTDSLLVSASLYGMQLEIVDEDALGRFFYGYFVFTFPPTFGCSFLKLIVLS